MNYFLRSSRQMQVVASHLLYKNSDTAKIIKVWYCWFKFVTLWIAFFMMWRVFSSVLFIRCRHLHVRMYALYSQYSSWKDQMWKFEYHNAKRLHMKSCIFLCGKVFFMWKSVLCEKETEWSSSYRNVQLQYWILVFTFHKTTVIIVQGPPIQRPKDYFRCMGELCSIAIESTVYFGTFQRLGYSLSKCLSGT